MNLKLLIQQYNPFNEQEAKDKELILKYMDTFDDLLTRNNEMAHLTASAWIVNKDKSKVLMIYHNIYNSWSWVGGHADGEENLLEVALKEANEETGLDNFTRLNNYIFSLEILGVDGHVKHGKYVANHLHLNVTYLLFADESKSIRIKPDENSGIQWFDKQQAVEKCSEPYMKIIYNKLNKKLDMI
ncbi:NUDIX hydrolase [Sedimentibacter sp. zth1]|uniref:NUDIX hydrolase n=1 Tax=Sedimentibacter sp. zth1 TaxID=2816908 RepID=UPI001A935E07|nr:NUDIX hydrolase [Sedimentibacter sp. zth1]QSX06636.1 NUDIX hydrolase [Sedimentibacter sp. zth1]